MKRWAAVLLATLAALSPPALAGDPATGSFESGGVSFRAGGAVAYRGKSPFDQADAILVAVSNARFNPAALADYSDRTLAIDRRFKDAQTAVVYFEFRPDGRYRGLSYDFGSGNGCGFCSGDVGSTVKLANERLVGRLAGAEKERKVDVALDVPLMPAPHGTKLPFDGGAPGKAYLAYHAAVVKRDAKALKGLLAPAFLADLARAESRGTLAAFVDALAEDHPTRAVSIAGGVGSADKAVLFVTGEGLAGRMRGEALLVREADGWRVADEVAALSP